MTTATDVTRDSWEEVNNDYLRAGLEWLEARIRQPDSKDDSAWWEDERWLSAPIPPALEVLGETLGLSRFERLTLFLAAAPEWGCDIGGVPPTVGLALRILPDAAWDVVSSQRPLRYWRLLHIHHSPPSAFVDAPISADERIANYLKGLNVLDSRLEHLLRRCEAPTELDLTPSQRSTVDEVVATFREAQAQSSAPVVELVGRDQEVMRSLAATSGQAMGRDMYELVGERLTSSGQDAAELLRLWERETVLTPLGLYIDVTDLDRANHDMLASWLADLEGVVFVGCREAWPVPRRQLRLIDARRPTADEQEQLWRVALQSETEAVDLPALLSGRFDLSQFAIRRAITFVATRGGDVTDLWRACKINAQPRLETLAMRIDPVAQWSDLVLPERELTALGHLVAQVRGRSKVLRHWGFGERITRGTGVTALFAGQSGTGKSLAAEIIAHELDLTVYRVDLSGVVSKYIGETERNLRRVFDAADEGGVLLLFDEADALFGKRSEVKDSHDRYANIEVNYLLQRMEDYAGIAILTTNQRQAIDNAFLRRLRFVVNFPFPAQEERRALWLRVFPHQTPVEELDVERLSMLAASGGMIRNIALNSAYTAAGNGTSVTTELVLSLAYLEFLKHELPVTEHDFRPTERQPA